MQVSKIISLYLSAVPGKLYEVEQERAFGTKSESEIRSVVSDSLRPHGLQPTRLLHSWDFPDESTGVGCRFLLQRIFQTQGSSLGLLHCRQTLYRLIHQRSLEPRTWIFIKNSLNHGVKLQDTKYFVRVGVFVLVFFFNDKKFQGFQLIQLEKLQNIYLL